MYFAWLLIFLSKYQEISQTIFFLLNEFHSACSQLTQRYTVTTVWTVLVAANITNVSQMNCIFIFRNESVF